MHIIRLHYIKLGTPPPPRGERAGRNHEDIDVPVKLEFQLQQSLKIPLSSVSLTQSAQKV